MYKKDQQMTINNKETVEEINEYPILALKDRGITKDTCEHFGVRVALSEEDGKTITAIYFPYTKKGKITGYKKRDLTKPKNDKGHFTAIGEVKIDCELFGQNVSPTGGKKVFIVEGELDQLATYQILKVKYPSATPTVLSIGLGTANAAAHVGNNLKYLDNFSEIVLAFDQDQATEADKKKNIKKGKEATQDVAMLIPEAKVAEFSENDPNDMLLAGKSEELYWALVSKAKTFIPEEISFGGDTPLDVLLEPLKEGIRVECLPKLMDKLHGLRTSEMTIILAPTKSGKTTICKSIGYDLVKNHGFVGHLFLEESIEKTQQSYLALDNSVLLPAFRENPSIVPRENLEKSYRELIANGRTLYMKANKITPKSVMTTMRYMAAMGAKYIILDHLSYVFSGDANHDERKAIDLLLTELASFKKEADVHLIVVAHIGRKGFQPRKDSDGEIIYPYWIPVNKEDGRGSAAFEQLCDNLITIEPEILNEGGERGRIRLKIAAAREWDMTGIADIVIMDRNTGRIVNAEQEISF